MNCPMGRWVCGWENEGGQSRLQSGTQQHCQNVDQECTGTDTGTAFWATTVIMCTSATFLNPDNRGLDC